ncbi:MAG: LysR substrate-binding domain-containing protein [Lacibacter sp.]
MTLTQLEYIVAVDNHRHFAEAAAACFVTQPTLSMQIGKLEAELGVTIFDRSKKPVIPTEIGSAILARARVILREAERLKQEISDSKGSMSGELRMGIIPTLAPYLLPPLFRRLRHKYPQLQLSIRETITRELVAELKHDRLDCALVVTPLKDASLNEEPLFYEELLVYVSPQNALHDKQYLLPRDIDPAQLWLLEEGHCFRSQILNLCELQKSSDPHFRYETGNIESLRRMVDQSDGITILPELAIQDFGPEQLKRVKRLAAPSPVREVSLVTHRNHIKTRLIRSLRNEIRSIIPPQMQELKEKKIVEI